MDPAPPITARSHSVEGSRYIPFLRHEPGITPTRARLRVRWKRLKSQAWGRTFRDLDARVLQYHEIPHSPFHSYIEADPVRFDLDKEGRPIFVEINLANTRVEIDECLRPPHDFELGAVRFLDFPSRIDLHSLAADEHNSLFHILLSDQPSVAALQPGRGIIWEVDADSCLAGVWLIKCQDDQYGRGRRCWRTRTWQAVRRRALMDGVSLRLSPISAQPEPEA